MSIYNDFQVSHNHERRIKQISGESELHYKMILDYLIFRNIPELVYKYKISTKEIYEIKTKNNWTDRVAKYDIACDKAYMKEIFTEILAYNNKKRENLFTLAKNIQEQIQNFQAYILVDPRQLMQNGRPSQIEMINIVRQSTRAMLDLQKLSKIINEELKAIGIDLSPANLRKFEQEEILGDCLLDQEDETEEITKSIFIQSGDYLNQVREEQKNSNNAAENTISSAGGGGCEADGGGIPDTQATTPNPLTQIQNFIDQTKSQLVELCPETSSAIEPVETLDEDEDDEEEYYDEFAPENHRYPFPMEYLIPVNEREAKK